VASASGVERADSPAGAPLETRGPECGRLLGSHPKGYPGLVDLASRRPRALWSGCLVPGVIAFVFYHTTAISHPVLYALEPNVDADSPEFRNTMAGMTGMPLIEGNRLEIYNDGDQFYPTMLDAIESARYSVTMEQFIFWDGRVGRRFADVLAGKALEGVPVKLLADAVGSAMLGDEILRILEAGGCQLAWFRPIHWYTLNRANLRTHRKSLIIDGRVAFTGGAGLADHWLGTAANEREWHDVEIRVEGPAVAVQQSGFAQNWLLSTGEIFGGPEFFPTPRMSGNVEVQTILSSPSSGAGAAATMYLIAVQCARRDLYIANPYFIPGVRLIDMLARACRRGVNVRLMVAGKHNDTWWARQNSLRLYGKRSGRAWGSMSLSPPCCIRKRWWWMAHGPPWEPPISTTVRSP
jgi:cardiolipin synthase A/B